MRIRKRQVPFPITSLSPVPLSDLHSPVVQLHQNLFQEDDTAAYYNRPSSDHSNQPIGDDKAVINNKLQVKDCPVKEEQGEKSNDTRRESLLGAHIETKVASSEEKCVEGEETFLSKKRKGNLKTTMEKVGNKMNEKMTKKGNNNDEDEEDYKEPKDGCGSSNASARKRAKGGALMEGSRCSRVNGRGWRCCQQTLVGYSLCEHHLGKGRLRSMNSVRSRSKKSAPVMTTTNHTKTLSNCSLSTTDDKDQEMKADNKSFDMGDRDYDVKEQKKPLMSSSKRKMKLGVVKARSISSLLGQASNGNADEENNK